MTVRSVLSTEISHLPLMTTLQNIFWLPDINRRPVLLVRTVRVRGLTLFAKHIGNTVGFHPSAGLCAELDCRASIGTANA